MRRLTRRGRGRSGPDSIDAELWLGRLSEGGHVGATELTPLSPEDAGGVPSHFAAVGRGLKPDGQPAVVAFHPHSGGDALLAAVAAAGHLKASEEGFSGEAIAASPRWTLGCRRRLGAFGDPGFRIRPLETPGLGEGAVDVTGEPLAEASVLELDHVAAHLADPVQRSLFARAQNALAGLAAKHGGAVRGTGRSVELVLLARRVAELRAESDGPVLQVLHPQRSTTVLSDEQLPSALDALEGQLRKRMNDRKVRDGEEGLRGRSLPLLEAALALRDVHAWPLGGSDSDIIDLVGLDGEGRPRIAVVREELDLPGLADALDALALLRPHLGAVLAHALAPRCLDQARLVIAAQAFTGGSALVLPALTLGHDLFELRAGRAGLELVPLSSGEGAELPTRSRRGRGRRAASGPRETEPRAASPEQRDESSEEEAPRRGRRRGRGGRGRGERRESAAAAPTEDGSEAGERERSAPRFDEMSSFDLDEESEGGGRGRGRRRRRRRPEPSVGDGDEESSAPTEAAERDEGGRGRRRGRRGRGRGEARSSVSATESVDAPPGSADDDSDEDLEALTELADDSDVFDQVIEPRYDDDDDADEGDSEEHRRRVEREKRRLARLTEREPEKTEPKRLRRRAAILAHADRDSLLAAVVLARDIRLVEGIWVYPQEELMTFFRSVATDLREDTPIHIVGFRPSPAHDVLQAAALYGERLTWFDHQDWPPEDLEALKRTLAEDSVHVHPGAGSSLAPLLETCTRRSRFSDKLVDLATGRFTEHDYARWGRLWWWRLGELAKQHGERRSDVEPLLTGRPSELAKEASKEEAPPLPAEVEFASRRDFRLVHFAGHTMVIIELEEGLDPHLASRIVRERYGAGISLTSEAGSDLLVLAGEDSNKRALDFAALVEHLAAKLDWVEMGADADHVARIRIVDLASKPERLDEVIGEVAMGRSILEG